MVTVEQVCQAFAEHAERHYPFLEPGIGAWSHFCPKCGGGAMRAGPCDTCAEADVEELDS